MLKAAAPAADAGPEEPDHPSGQPTESLARLPRLAALCMAGVVLLALATVYQGANELAQRHLQQDAERSATALAEHLRRHVPDLDLILAGDLPSPGAQTQLTALRDGAGVLGFMLFDAAGVLRLDGASTGTLPAPLPAADPRAVAAVSAAASGRARTLLQDEAGSSDRAGSAVRSLSYVPLKGGGAVQGVVAISLDQRERAAITAASFRTAALLAGGVIGGMLLAALALWRWRARHIGDAEARARFLARHDALTGALNRSSFHGALARACAGPGAGLAVLTIDIDFFKDINERLGQAAGNRMLREVARRLQGELRGGDLLARMGGDQFAVLQAGVSGSAGVRPLAQRLLAALKQPYALDGQATPGSATIGVALHGTDGTEADSLLHHAELALTRAKGLCRGSWSFYDAGLDGELQGRRALTQELRQAIAHGGLQLHYQPLYDSDGRTLRGYEALARWPHAQRGFVPPLEFIGLAEEQGLIEPLGRWVLASACREAATWPAGLTVSVNVSPAQFRREGSLCEDVRVALAEAGLPASRLELEITESMLMGTPDEPQAGLLTLQALRELGLRIAIDDFGTGYSNFNTLWRFPIDRLKIDRSFTRSLGSGDVKAELIVRAMVSMARTLGLRVTAEGVETAAQMQALRHHGCDTLQGYLLGRPLPAAQLPHLPQPAPGAAATPAGPAASAPWPQAAGSAAAA